MITGPFVIALITCLAGFVVLVMAWRYFDAEKSTADKIGAALDVATDAVKDSTESAKAASAKALTDTGTAGAGLGTTAQLHSASVNGAAEFVKSLGELATAISKLSRTIQAIFLAIVLFFIAAVTALGGNLTGSNDGAGPSPSAGASARPSGFASPSR